VKKTLAASALCAGALVMSLASPALADPTDLNPAPINGSGSDTTEIVMRALDAAIPDLGNWDVTGTTPYDTNGAGTGCSFGTRIAGSGAGRVALANSVTLNDGCWQFARSSSRAVSATPGTTAGTYTASGSPVDLLPITLATDGLTYVFRAGSGTPRNLTLGQLRAIYSCTFTGTVDGLSMGLPSVPNKPLLPTDASGSRADWLTLMGQPSTGEVASDGGALPSCIDDGPGDTGIAGGEISEHNGNVLTSGRQIILHSIPSFIAQGRASTGDFRGLSVLGYINGNVPIQLYDNPGGTLSSATASGSTIVDGALFRPVYNIVPASQVTDPTIQGIFGVRSGGTNPAASGDVPNVNSGAICTQNQIVIQNGFVPAC
jgi:hypothetical protein